MNFRTLVLGVSAAANLGLLALILVGSLSEEVSPAKASAAARRSGPSRPVHAIGEITSQTWRQLTDGDLPSQVARLRAEGFPPAMIRAIMAAQIREGNAARRQALETNVRVPYWRQAQSDPQKAVGLRALVREENARLEALLGPDPENGRVAVLSRMFPHFATEKIAQIVAIVERNDEQANAPRPRVSTDPDSLRDLTRELEMKLEADLAGVLTPGELEDYQLRFGRVATSLRFDLEAFDISEPELRTLARLQHAYQDRVAYSVSQTPEQSRARDDAEKALNTEIKAAFGDARFAEYQRAKEYEYREAQKLVTRLQLPAEVTDQLYALRKEAMAGTRQSDPEFRAMSPEERHERMASLATQARQKLPALLGADGYRAYLDNQGAWLTNLEERVAETKKAP